MSASTVTQRTLGIALLCGSIVLSAAGQLGMKAGMLARIFLYHATLGTSAISFIFLVALNFRAL